MKQPIATKHSKQIFNQLTASFLNYTPTFLKLLILEHKLKSTKRLLHAEALTDYPADTPMQSAPLLLSEDSVAQLTVSLATEQKEKEKRQLNIIVHNIAAQTEHPGRKMTFLNAQLYSRNTLEF